MMNEYVLARIQAIQQELEDLRKFVTYSIKSPECKVKRIKLKGLWKGVDVAEKDLEEAKRAVFKDAYKPRKGGAIISWHLQNLL